MFDKQYRFRGRHAVRVDKLTGVFDTNSKAKLFERNVDVRQSYLFAGRVDLQLQDYHAFR